LEDGGFFLKKIITGYECLNCFVSQIDKMSNSIGKTEEEKKELFLNALNFLSGIKDFNVPPPEVARQLYKFIRASTGVYDPYKEIKSSTNETALQVINDILDSCPQPVMEDFIKFSVAGNIIDFGVGKNRTEYSVEKLTEIVLNINLDINDSKIFTDSLNSAETLLYILDNSGEVIFDKYFISHIKNQYEHLKIFIAARNDCIINDITVKDAEELGMGDLGEIVSTGYNGPGVYLGSCSEQFLKLFENADIIVSKGQGNFETLWGCRQNIFYALKIKCNHVAKATGFNLNANLFIHGCTND
jgi:uncharacterized protein with ATP-grasp and redox domains